MTDIRRQVVVEGVLASAVADDATLVLAAYPTGTDQAFFTGGNASATATLMLDDNDKYEQATADNFDVTYGASDITITNRSGATWAAGRSYKIGLAYADQKYVFSGQKSAAITALTDNSGGTASNTLAAITGSYVEATIENTVASLAAKINELRTAMVKAGIIES
jgi:hypothetical protein